MHVDLEEKLKRIKALMLDVDGVMTDGGIIYSDAGEEIKAFNVRDGLGVRLLTGAGLAVGVVTGRRSGALDRRCRELGIAHLYDGADDKAGVLDRITADTGARPEEIAFAGDDLPDLPLMRRVGLAVAVADAHEVVRKNADLTTRAIGGGGAVREICETILAAQGKWDDCLKAWLT